MYSGVKDCRMLCAPLFWMGRGGPQILGALGILALMLCHCSGHRDYSDEGILPGKGTGGTSAKAEEEPRQPAGQTIPIFIHMDATEYSLPCSPREMHVTNPTYRWTQDNRESQSLSAGAQGDLNFQHFQGRSSGNYSCTISYQEQRHPRDQTFHYTVQAYHVRGSLEALLIFRSRLCQEALKKRLLWSLQEALGRVASAHHCWLELGKSSCFPTLQEPWDEFNLQVQFQVSPFGPEWDKHCDPHNQTTVIHCYRAAVRDNLLQAKLAMTRFLEKHGPFPVTGAGAPRAIFTNHFTSFLKTEHCAGGYGLSLQLETCPDCCILCLPGTFSTPQSNECTVCPVGTFNPLYGRVVCSRCQAGLVTRATGATSAGDCVEEEVPVRLRIPVMVFIILLPPLGCSCLIILGCYWCHHCRQKRSAPPWAFGGAAGTAAGPQAPQALSVARPPDTAASKTVSLAGSPSAGASKDSFPGAAAASGTLHLAASALARASLEHLPPLPSPAGEVSNGEFVFPSPPVLSPAGSALAGKDSPRLTYAAGGPGAGASGETLPLGTSASALAGKDSPSIPYTARVPGAAAASGTLPQGTSAPAGASLEDLPPPPSPAGEVSNREFVFPSPPVLSPAGSALAGKDSPRPFYRAGAPGAAASGDTLPLGASASALAGKDSPSIPYTAGVPGAAAASGTLPLGASAPTGASMEDLPPPPSLAGDVSNGDFVFPSPPVLSPAGSVGNTRPPS